MNNEKYFDFNETEKGLHYDAAITEASRCLMCDTAPCEIGCPARIDIKKFIRAIRFDNFRYAIKIIRNTNILPGVCARVCNTSKQCQYECNSSKLTVPIDIGKLQRFVTDWEMMHGYMTPLISDSKTENIAIIGSGPSGLSCAAVLRMHGYTVDIYEERDVLGGELIGGIPTYRLPISVVEHEISYLKALGINFHTNKRIESLDELIGKGYSAIFLAVGLNKSIIPDIEGSYLKGVMTSDKLFRNSWNDTLRHKISIGKRAAVIGGGNSAIDAARVLIRLGCEDVQVIYRRSENLMPAWKHEIAHAIDEGVYFRYLTNPVRFTGKDKLTGIELCNMLLEKQKGEIRPVPVPVENSKYHIEVDNVIIAMGKTVDVKLLDKWKIETIKDKYISLNDNGMTNIEGVFASGDAIGGDQTVVHSIMKGKKAATDIIRYLSEKDIEHNKASLFHVTKPEAETDLSMEFCGIKFDNPFILAATPSTDDLEMLRRGFDAGWSGAVLKTTSVEGNPVPLKYPMMTSMEYQGKKVTGLGNIDLISEHHIDVLEQRIRILKKEYPEKVVIASIMGEKQEDWQSLVRRLEDVGADMIECSFSCPQGTLGSKPGFMLGQDNNLVKLTTSWVKEASRNIPVVIKITPQVVDITETAQAVKDGGGDAVCASNSIPSLMGINIDTFIPNPDVGGRSTYSGFTGPAIKPITLRTIAEIAKNVDIPISGTGGPVNWKDAIEMMLVGAGIIQFGTAVMHYGFDIIDDLKNGLIYYMADKKIERIKELIGKSLKHIVSHDELIYKTRIVSKINKELCVKDKLCYISCRDGGHIAIEVNEDGYPVVDKEKCVGCGMCLTVCPVSGCIELVPK